MILTTADIPGNILNGFTISIPDVAWSIEILRLYRCEILVKFPAALLGGFKENCAAILDEI